MSRHNRTPKLVLTLVALSAIALGAGMASAGGPPKGPSKCAVGAVGGEDCAAPWMLLALAAGVVGLRRGLRLPK